MQFSIYKCEHGYNVQDAVAFNNGGSYKIHAFTTLKEAFAFIEAQFKLPPPERRK